MVHGPPQRRVPLCVTCVHVSTQPDQVGHVPHPVPRGLLGRHDQGGPALAPHGHRKVGAGVGEEAGDDGGLGKGGGGSLRIQLRCYVTLLFLLLQVAGINGWWGAKTWPLKQGSTTNDTGSLRTTRPTPKYLILRA